MKTLLAAVALLAGSIPAASGQTFPSRTLTLVVPFAAGWPTDTIGGIGTPSHIASIYFQNIVGARVQSVPYRGAAPAMKDILAGHVDMMFDQAANSLPQVRAGTIKAYAVTASARLAAAPDIPTVDEAGLDKFYMSIWHAIWAPRSTPKNAVARHNAAILESLADPAVPKRLAELGH